VIAAPYDAEPGSWVDRTATGKEVYAGAFGRRKVQQARQSQGWSFS
jgi:hypothetical protein